MHPWILYLVSGPCLSLDAEQRFDTACSVRGSWQTRRGESAISGRNQSILLQGQHALCLRTWYSMQVMEGASVYRYLRYFAQATRERRWTPHCDRRSAIADGCCSVSQNDSSLARRRVTAGKAVHPKADSLRSSIRSLDAGHWLQGAAAGVEGSALTRRLEIATRATHGRVRPSTRRGPLDVSASRLPLRLVAPRAYPEGERRVKKM